jgi:hypothetical protein
VLRVVNRTPFPTTLTVARDGAPLTGEVIDVAGAPRGLFTGGAELRAWEILTLRLAEG